MEAYTQGGKAGAGAAAAVTGEVGAKLISEQVFGKSPENLTEAEKRTVSELSQVAAGLAGGLSSSGGNSLSTAQAVKIGQEVGKNAVENNLLTKEDDEYVFESSKIFDKDGSLNERRKYKTQQLLIKSKEIDLLLQQYQKDPSSLNEIQRNYLHNELIEISNSYGISVDKLYNWDFNSGYRRDDSSLSKYLASEYYRQNLSYEAKQGQSMATGIVSLPSVAYGYRFVPELGKFVLANPIKSETAMVVGYKSGKLVGEEKVFVNGKFNQQGVEDIAKDGLKTLTLGKLPWWQQSLYGTAIDYGYEVNKSNATPQSVKTEMIGSGAGVAVSGISELGSKIEPKFNGIGKIFTNIILNDKVSDYVKNKYNEKQEREQE